MLEPEVLQCDPVRGGLFLASNDECGRMPWSLDARALLAPLQQLHLDEGAHR